MVFSLLCLPPLFPLLCVRLKQLISKPKEGLFWQADHIVPVCEGGGECDLSNYRTLCTPCHDKETRKLTFSASHTSSLSLSVCVFVCVCVCILLKLNPSPLDIACLTPFFVVLLLQTAHSVRFALQQKYPRTSVGSLLRNLLWPWWLRRI